MNLNGRPARVLPYPVSTLPPGGTLSRRARYWDFVLLVALLVVSVWTPYEVAYVHEKNVPLRKGLEGGDASGGGRQSLMRR